MTQMTILDDVFYGEVKSSRKKLVSQLFTNEQKQSPNLNEKNNVQRDGQLLNNFKTKFKQFTPYSNQRDKLGKLIKNQRSSSNLQQIQKEAPIQIESQLTDFKSSSVFPSSNISKLETKLYSSFKLTDIDHFPQKKINQNHKSELLKYKSDVIGLFKSKNTKNTQYQGLYRYKNIKNTEHHKGLIKEQRNPQLEVKNHQQQKLHFRSKSVQNIQKSQILKRSSSVKEKDVKPQIMKAINYKKNEKKQKQLITAKLNVHFNHQELARYKQIRKLSLKLCDNLAQSQEKYNQNMRAIQRIKQNSIRQLIK